MNIHTRQDVRKLQGKFVLRIIIKELEKRLTNNNWMFMADRRLFIILGLNFMDLNGHRSHFKSFEEFKTFFNYTPEDGGRYHRLLTRNEIDLLCRKLDEINRN